MNKNDMVPCVGPRGHDSSIHTQVPVYWNHKRCVALAPKGEELCAVHRKEVGYWKGQFNVRLPFVNGSRT